MSIAPAAPTGAAFSAVSALQAALRVVRAVTGNSDPRQMVRDITAALRQAIPADFVGVTVVSEDGSFELATVDPPIRMASKQVTDYYGGGHLTDDGPVIFGEEDVRGRFPVQWDLWQSLGVRSACSLPMKVNARRTGLVSFWSRRADAFTDVDLAMAKQLARAVAVIIDSRLAFNQLQRLRDEAADENASLLAETRRDPASSLIGDCAALRWVKEQVELVGPTASTVLLTGESGTGKDLVARAIHDASPRRDRPFVVINCAALPTSLAESELFGHEEGAFTGASRRRKGRFEMAHEGTLFLDEIGELPLESQAKLLRVLEQRSFERVGGSDTLHVDVRILAATNQDLPRMVAEKRFREDLFYRLSVFPLTLPALRQRREDIPRLAEFFLRAAAARLRRPRLRLGEQAASRLLEYDWPGNVRELQNAVDRAAIVAQDEEIGPDDLLPARLLGARRAPSVEGVPATVAPEPRGREQALREEYRAALEECSWVIEGPEGAAARLRVHPNTLRYRLKRLGLNRPGRPANG